MDRRIKKPELRQSIMMGSYALDVLARTGQPGGPGPDERELIQASQVLVSAVLEHYPGSRTPRMPARLREAIQGNSDNDLQDAI